MNLVTDPWIPVLFRDGTQDEVSLADAFARGREISDLATPPHERIALLRLLVCVAQAALDGPEDEDDWPEVDAAVQGAVAEYLRKWHDRFELFGEGPRFLQAKQAAMSEFEISKLLFHRACGNNATLFDHEGGTERRLRPAEIARALLCFQNLSAPIGAGYTGKPPCLDRHFLQTWLIGENLTATVLANGIDKQTAGDHCPAGFGRPVWEREMDFKDESFLENTTLSLLGRLVPVTRCVWLAEDGRSFAMAKPGIKHPMFEEYREPAATVLSVEKKTGVERFLLGARLDKQPWRDLQNVFRADSGSKLGRPLPLQRSEPAEFKRVWLGALVTDGKAKYEDTMEAVYSPPRELLQPDALAIYRAGVEEANQSAYALRMAVTDYAKDLKAEVQTGTAERHYWNSMEQHVDELFGVARSLGKEDFPDRETGWRLLCRRQSESAFRHACPCDSPRQIQAFAKGWRRLRLVQLKQQKDKETK